MFPTRSGRRRKKKGERSAERTEGTPKKTEIVDVKATKKRQPLVVEKTTLDERNAVLNVTEVVDDAKGNLEKTATEKPNENEKILLLNLQKQKLELSQRPASQKNRKVETLSRNLVEKL